jgi:hypothetical protein
MGGTISFVDNVPHGTVMTLRIPQSYKPDAVTAVADDDSSTAADSTTATAAASSNELSSEAVVSSLAVAPAESTAADNEMLLRTKRILVIAIVTRHMGDTP